MKSSQLISTAPQGLPPQSDVLVSEAHHRIANNLTMLSGLVRLEAADVARRDHPLSPREAAQRLAGIAARVETVAHLHRLLSPSPPGARIDFAQYLASTCEALAQAIGIADDTCVVCRAAACDMDIDRAALVGLIVSELITNAVKHAHPAGAPGRVTVACEPADDGALALTVADDGAGLRVGFDPAAGDGLGVRLVRSLTAQLGASLEWESSELGLKVRVTLPAGGDHPPFRPRP